MPLRPFAQVGATRPNPGAARCSRAGPARSGCEALISGRPTAADEPGTDEIHSRVHANLTSRFMEYRVARCTFRVPGSFSFEWSNASVRGGPKESVPLRPAEIRLPDFSFMLIISENFQQG